MSQILFSFQGRISRVTYWIALVSLTLVFYAGFRAVVASGDSIAGLILLMIPVLWIALATQVKRWQDIGWSGWLVLLGLVPYIGLPISIVCLGFIKGTAGPNKYGDDPLPPGRGSQIENGG